MERNFFAAAALCMIAVIRFLNSYLFFDTVRQRTKTRIVVSVSFAMVFSGLLATGPAVAGWDVSADFSTTSNVAGNVWTYGRVPYSAGQGSTPDVTGFILYDQADPPTVVFPFFVWKEATAASFDTFGGVSYNDSGTFQTAFGIDWEPMEVDLIPDQTGWYVTTVRFTAPQTGLYDVNAQFADNQNCCAGREGDAWILTDSATVFHVDKLPSSDGLLTHTTGTLRDWVLYDGMLSLVAGDSIYFASGKGATGGDHVILRGTVDLVPVPEPTTLALFGLGLVGLGLARRKRKAA